MFSKAKYQGIVQVAVLPEKFRPSVMNKDDHRRLIFIGDVHGAYSELVSLLEQVNYNSSTGILVIKASHNRSRSIPGISAIQRPTLFKGGKTCHGIERLVCYWQS